MIEVEIDGLCFKIRLKGTTLSEIIQQLNDEEFISLLEQMKRISDAHVPSPRKLGSDIISYVSSHHVDSTTNRILLCMAFASTYEGQEILNKNDIEDLLFRIREGIPLNTNALLNNLESQGLIVRHRSKKQGRIAFYLSQRGIEHIRNMPERDLE